jgi:hypothetical protein
MTLGSGIAIASMWLAVAVVGRLGHDVVAIVAMLAFLASVAVVALPLLGAAP